MASAGRAVLGGLFWDAKAHTCLQVEERDSLVSLGCRKEAEGPVVSSLHFPWDAGWRLLSGEWEVSKSG